MPHPLVITALFIGGKMIYDYWNKQVSSDDVYNCNDLLTKFHDGHVRLDKVRWNELKKHGSDAHERVLRGLKANENPSPCEHMLQGSFGMHTVVKQHPDAPDEHYDIDLGIVFNKGDLHGPNGGMMTPLDVRTMVFEAIGNDERFSTAPEKKTNCVRINYPDHHVDIPSYRFADEKDDAPYELASSEWKQSNPKAVTKWFNSAVIAKSPDEGNGRQLRRITRLLKFYAKSRPSWNAPSGLIISKLVVDCYPNEGFSERDDVALFITMDCIHESLENSLEVKHPVLNEYITKSDSDPCMVEFRNNLKKSLEYLNILLDEEVTNIAARKAWGKVFNHAFFDESTSRNSSGSGPSLGITNHTPKNPVRREDGNRRYG